MSDSADLAALSLKELKALIASAGLSTADCIDKDDLRARAREAQQALASKPAPPEPAAPSQGAAGKQLGGYDCIVQGEGAPADLLLIVLHGLGATNSDLAPVPGMVAQLDPALRSARIVSVCPQAPMGPMGAAWWQFDVMSYMQALMTKDQALMAKLLRQKPEGIDACRSAMGRLVDEARALAACGGEPLPMSRVVMVGFSLGAITALDIALLQPAEQPVGGVVFMNGAPICVEDWAAHAQQRTNLRVHMSAGANDQTLPEFACGWARDLLTTNGIKPEYKVHPGGHEVGGRDIVESIARFVGQILAAAGAASK